MRIAFRLAVLAVAFALTACPNDNPTDPTDASTCAKPCGTKCCTASQTCDPSTKTCKDACVPACTGKDCGDNGCGGTCGDCTDGKTCSAAGKCEAACVPACTGKTCGDNGCGGTCGTCETGKFCDATSNCQTGCGASTDCAAVAGKPLCDTVTHACVACVLDTDCTGAVPRRCNPADKTCVGCLATSDCAAGNYCDQADKTCKAGCAVNDDCATVTGKPVCDTVAHACVACLSDANCGGATKKCDTTKATCVECLVKADCASGSYCDTADNRCKAGCAANADCAGVTGKPVCDVANKTCVGCLDDASCTGTEKKCDTSVKMCVGCLATAECGAGNWCDTSNKTCKAGCDADGGCSTVAGKPKCDVPAHACVGCLDDSSCAAGAAKKCDTTAKVCVACLATADCDATEYCDATAKTCLTGCDADARCTEAGKPACNQTSHTCVTCTADSFCTTSPAEKCDTAINACVECLAKADCDAGEFCHPVQQACLAGDCGADADCSGVAGKPKCDVAATTCVGCLVNDDCSGATPVCGAAKTCVECATNADCAGVTGKPVCNASGACEAAPQVAPSFTSTAGTTATVGVAYTYTATASGSPTPTLAGTTVPAWLTFNATTGVLSGTPAATDVGPHSVTLTATNGVSPDATQTFTVTVSPAPQAPAFTSTPVLAAMVGSAYTYTAVATGEPAPTLAATTIPSWLVFNAGTGVLSGTPGAAAVGDHQVTLTATNGVSPDATQTFTITVAPIPSIAIAGNPYFEGFGSGLGTGWVSALGWQAGTPTLGASSVGPPSLYDGDCVATNLTGSYSSSAHWTLQTPVFDFTGVTDPRLRFAHWFNFEGSATTTRYDGGNIKISTDGGTTWEQLVPASITPAYTGAISASSNAMNGQLAFSGISTAWQLVTVDLAANLAAKPLTQVRFRFDLGSDSSNNRPGWYVDSVQVAAAAEMPVAPAITSTPSVVTVVSGTPWSYTVTATGTPAPTLTATLGNGDPLPAWLTFNATTGVLSGTPAATDAGTLQILVTAANGMSPNATQTFTLTVNAMAALVTYVFDGDVKTPATVAADVTASDCDNRVGTGTFVGGNPSTGRALTSSGFTSETDPNYFAFTVTPAVGKQVQLANLAFDLTRSSSGPVSFQAQVVVGTTVTPIGTVATLPAAWTTTSLTLGAAEGGPFYDPVTIRIAAWGTTNAGGTLRVDNISLSGTVTDRAPMAPVVSSAAVTTAQAGVAYSYPIVVKGWPVPTVAVTGRPTWLVYDAPTQTLSGTPTLLNVGTSGTITVTATNGVTPAGTQTFTIAVAPPAGTSTVIADGTPAFEGFGTALPTGWVASTGWEFGIPATGSSTVGPPSVYSGELAATRLAGDYVSSAFWSLVTPMYDLTGVTAPTLQFMHWYNTERSGTTNYDGINVKLSTDGGATWAQLVAGSVTPAYTGALATGTAGMAGQQGWSGTLTNWERVTVDLAANLASKPTDRVLVRFDLGSDSYGNRPGWYLDDVKIGAVADMGVAPTISSSPRGVAREGSVYSYTVVATGLPAPTLAATTLPAWLTFDAPTGVLTGTPATADVGTHPVVLTATNATGTATQSFSIQVLSATATPVFTDDFEGDPAATEWTMGFTTGTAGEWAIGTPNLAAGPAACHSGAQCAATNLTANYAAEDRLSYLQTPVLDLTGVIEPGVQFFHWFRTESGYDGGNIKISTDGGATFVPLTAGSVVPAYNGTISTSYNNPLKGQSVWTGTGTSWTVVNVNLVPNLNTLPVNQVVIRFEFGSDDDASYPGWYVDDVKVGEAATF